MQRHAGLRMLLLDRTVHTMNSTFRQGRPYNACYLWTGPSLQRMQLLDRVVHATNAILDRALHATNYTFIQPVTTESPTQLLDRALYAVNATFRQGRPTMNSIFRQACPCNEFYFQTKPSTQWMLFLKRAVHTTNSTFKPVNRAVHTTNVTFKQSRPHNQCYF